MKRYIRRIIRTLKAQGIRFRMRRWREIQTWSQKDAEDYDDMLRSSVEIHRKKDRGYRWKPCGRAFWLTHHMNMKTRLLYGFTFHDCIEFARRRCEGYVSEAARRHEERKSRQRMHAGGRG